MKKRILNFAHYSPLLVKLAILACRIGQNARESLGDRNTSITRIFSQPETGLLVRERTSALALPTQQQPTEQFYPHNVSTGAMRIEISEIIYERLIEELLGYEESKGNKHLTPKFGIHYYQSSKKSLSQC